MKAISIKKPGGSEQLEIQERPVPSLEEGELLIKVQASAINRTDTLTRENKQLSEPYPILGVEVAGIVVDSNLADEKIAIGTRIAGLVNHGGYAEYVAMPADRVFHMPDTMSFGGSCCYSRSLFNSVPNTLLVRKVETGGDGSDSCRS